MAMKEKLEALGWFKVPPRKSMLRRQPACAWFTAGTAQVTQQHKFLPCLDKTVLRNAVKRWIELHFYLPVAGDVPNEGNKHINFMEHFVTFVWGYYSVNQRPSVPAFTNVGRFLFTYIWRQQHALFR